MTDCFEQLIDQAKDAHHFLENLFFDQFLHFLSSWFFAKDVKKLKFSGFNAKRLEIKLRAQTRYDIPYSDLFLHYASHNTDFLGQKKDSGF